MKKDSLGDRMKYYENITRIYLEKKKPVIMRIDGKAFHTFTKGCVKPYDDKIIRTMQATTEFLMKNIQGAKVGYVQSDEISILITDYDNEDTSAWFDYNVQKMVSVGASMAGVQFTHEYGKLSDLWPGKTFMFKPAYFDARAWNVPKDEIMNTFRWRYFDCTRNSMSMLAQSLYSQNQLNGKNWEEQRAMCAEKGQDWYKLGGVYRNGTLYYWSREIDGKKILSHNSEIDLGSNEFCHNVFGEYE